MTKTQINLDIFTKEEIPYTVFTIIYKTDNGYILTFDCNKINDTLALDFSFNSNIYKNTYCIKIKPIDLYFVGKFLENVNFLNKNNDVKIFYSKNIQSIYIDLDKQVNMTI